MIKGELPVPAAILTAKSAAEIARIWVVDGQQYVALNAGIWRDPEAWGLMLVDFAHHIARAYQQTGGPSSEEALMRIRRAFDAEWSAPTDEGCGST